MDDIKVKCLDVLRNKKIPEIDKLSLGKDRVPGQRDELGNGSFCGVYRVKAVETTYSHQQNNGLLRLKEDIGVELAVVKSPNASSINSFVLSISLRKVPLEKRVEKVLRYYGRECDIWIKIAGDPVRARESNLLQFYGFVESYDFNNLPAFVAKFYPLGDARSYIDHATQPSMSNKQKIYLISDIAKALAFIHSECKIAHRDVKGSNILLEAGQHRLIGILGDFGSAKEFTLEAPGLISSSEAGGNPWCPPEYKNGGFHKDSGPGDIWSLGCTMLELLQEANPWYQVRQLEYSRKIAEGQHPPEGDKVLQHHYDFMGKFWMTSDKRPSAEEVHLQTAHLAECCNT